MASQQSMIDPESCGRRAHAETPPSAPRGWGRPSPRGHGLRRPWPCVFAAAIALVALSALSAQMVVAQPPETPESAGTPEAPQEPAAINFGGPDAGPNRMAADRAETGLLGEIELLSPYYDWKDSIRKDYGYSFSLAHISTFIQASDSLPGTDDNAASAVFRHTGSWELFGRGTPNRGTLQYLVEYRHRYTDNLPSLLSLESLGNAGFIGIPFANDQWHLTNLYWDQAWNDGDIEIYIGFLDVTDFVDVYALTSPWTDFFNFSFSIGAGTIDLPDDAALGLAAGAYLFDNVYMMAGLEDLNSDPHRPFDGFESLFDDHELFKHVEIGWAGIREAWYLDNIHLTLWHADERDDLGIQDGWGAVLSFSKPIDDQWLIFVRGGYADGGGGLLQKSVSAGFGYQPHTAGIGVGDQLGVAFNWGQPNDEVFGNDLDDQYAVEAYYRLQISRELAITFDAQVLFNPALNPEKDTIWVFGIRARVVF